MSLGTFGGLEMARKALFAQQSAIYTTGHNISNANTDGYSRQRVNFESTKPFPVPSRVQPQIAGQLGTGVKAGSVQRIRDQFLDAQYRAENSKLGFWETKSKSFSRMEELLNEPSEHGLSHTMDEFWQSLQDLAVNPDNTGARSVVAQRGLAVTETFNHLSKNLNSIQADLKSQIDVMAGVAGDDKKPGQINTLLKTINEINQHIQKVEPHGYVANDLYDDRDRLIDELSGMVNIKVHHDKSAESSKDIADGIVSIELVDESGKSFGQTKDDRIFLIDARPGILNENGDPREFNLAKAHNQLDINFNDEGLATEVILKNQDGEELNLDLPKLLQSSGSIAALIEANGHLDQDDKPVGDYPDMSAELDKMANEFAKAFNKIHSEGMDFNGEEDIEDFFQTSDSAGTITVNSKILKDPKLIAAADPEKGSKNGDNASRLADLFEDGLNEDAEGLGGLGGASVQDFFASLIGDLGVKASEANRMRDNTGVLQVQVDNERMSVSAVSLDEEMSNLIKFQHAYNAAARNMTAVDEMLDRIINNMGLVGR